MLDNLIKIPTKDHEEWLKLRHESIGGSDAPIIVGANDYKSPYALWFEKVSDEEPEFKGNEATRQGTDLEPYVAFRFEEKTGKKCIEIPETLKNPEYPFAHANIDRWVSGENSGLECKTTNTFNHVKFTEDGEFPLLYYFQCLHYMAVTGATKWYLAVLVFGKDFHLYEIERDEKQIEALMEMEREFFELIKTNTPPEVDGSESTAKAQSERFSEPVDESVRLFLVDDSIEKLIKLKNEKKSLEDEIKRIEQSLKEELGNNTLGETEQFMLTFKPQIRKSFDSKKFMKDHPELDYSNYFKESSFRTLRVKEIE